MSDKESALIVGAGPGLGAALARRFVMAGMDVAVAARDPDGLDAVAKASGAKAFTCDATEEKAVEGLFQAVAADLGPLRLVVYNAGAFIRGSITDISPTDFERAWRILCLGGFHVGQHAARAMLEAGQGGTILFTGATASLRGGAGFANLAVGKFGLRALAQTMARELGPKGIHIAHVIVDGQILSEQSRDAAERPEDALLAPDAIAEAYFQLHRQAKSGWSFELDLRPWVERF